VALVSGYLHACSGYAFSSCCQKFPEGMKMAVCQEHLLNAAFVTLETLSGICHAESSFFNSQ